MFAAPASGKSYFDDPRCKSSASCDGICGLNLVGVNTTCACDTSCKVFGDCCQDYDDLCAEGKVPGFVHQHGEVECYPPHANRNEKVRH